MGEKITAATGGGRFVVIHDFPSTDLEAVWREFLARAESPGQYDAPDFFLEPYWKGSNPFAVLAFEGERIIASATGLHTMGTVTCGLPSRPQVCVAKDVDATLASNILVDGLLQEAGASDLITIYGWEWTPLPAFSKRGFRTRRLSGDMVLDLKPGADALFKQFHKNRRVNIKAALKNGIVISEAETAEDIAAYLDVYSGWLATKRKKIETKPNLAAIAETHEMPENHRRFLARHQGRVIAASGVRFLRGGLIEYAGNCSYDEFIQLRPNELLFWTTVQWACAQGFSKYSLGGAHFFLRNWGGTIVPICRYTLDRSFLRRHHLKEDIRRVAGQVVNRMPEPFGPAIRRVLRRPQ